jgi:hypothetical protein
MTNMQPMPKMPTMAVLVREFMRKFQIRATGSNPIVRSVMAAPILYRYAMPMRTFFATQCPVGESWCQKWSTGVHWNIVKKRKIKPTTVASEIAA